VPAPEIAPTDAQDDEDHRWARALDQPDRHGQASPAGAFRRWRSTRPADATSVEITLDRGRTVSWEVTSGEVPPPSDGTVLSLEPQADSGTEEPTCTGRMEGGRIVVDGVPSEPTHWLAVAPDGSQAALSALPGQSEGNATRFVRTRQVDVRLRWSDGAPASGLFVSLHDQGNNQMGSVAKTDADGAATIARLEPCQVDVFVGTTNPPSAGRRVATADLRRGSAHVESTLPRRREGTISVLLDGVPGLPESIVPWNIGADSVQILGRDPKAGTLRVSVWPTVTEAGLTLSLDAPGWVQEAASRCPADPGSSRRGSRSTGRDAWTSKSSGRPSQPSSCGSIGWTRRPRRGSSGRSPPPRGARGRRGSSRTGTGASRPCPRGGTASATRVRPRSRPTSTSWPG
jgi:hypothetical protein